MNVIELRETMRNELESQYVRCLVAEDYKGAYNIVGTLMDYKLLNADDDRITKDSTLMKKAGAEKKHTFPHDYRKDSNYFPKWVVCNLSELIKTELTMERHWGKRIEGSYEGDVIFNERNVKFRMRRVTNKNKAGDIANSVVRDYSEFKKKSLNVESIKNGITEGDSLAYSIDKEDSTSYRYGTIGYVYIYFKDNVITCFISIEHDKLKETYVMLRKAYKNIALDIQKNIKDECAKKGYKLKILAICGNDYLETLGSKQEDDLAQNVKSGDKAKNKLANEKLKEATNEAG